MIGRNRTAQRNRLLCAICVGLALAFCACAAIAQPFALKDGETVVFYGDSITAQRLYTRDVEAFVLTRYPSLHVRFVNAGVPGDTAAGGYAGAMAERVHRDVAPWQPNMIAVMLGMNDGGWGYGSPDQIDADFQKNYNALLDSLREAAPHAALTLITPTPYDEMTHGTEFPGYSRMIDRLAGDIDHIAAQLQAAGGPPVLLADFHCHMVEALQHATASDPQLAALLIPDRIHPAEAGHWIMAAVLMAAWHADPTVSSVALNAESASVTASERTTITHLQKSEDGLEWSELDEALPLPLDFNNAMTPLLLQISNLADLDRQMLRVDSLAPGQYALSIDGKSIASFSQQELERGINLALYKTPMVDQARGITGTETQRAELDQARFMLSADVKQSATTGIAEATLRQAERELDAAVRPETMPKPHHFELERQVSPASQNQPRLEGAQQKRKVESAAGEP